MTHHRWLVTVIAAVLLLGTGGYWALSRGEPPPAPAPEAAASTPAKTSASAPPQEAPTATAGRRSRTWAPGSQFVYTLSADQRVSFGQQGQAAAPSVRLSLQGELSVTVVGTQGDRVNALVQLLPSAFSFEMDGRSALDEQTRPQFQSHLQAAFYITFNRQGAALLAHFERDVDPVTQNFLRTLVSATQFVTPNEPQETWSAQELDVTGLYAAAYRTGAGPRRYEKTKERYLRITSPSGLRAIDASMKIHVEASATFSLGEEGWPEKVSSQEQVSVVAGEGMPSVQGEGRVELNRTAVRTMPLLIGSLEARRPYLNTASLATQVYAPEDPKAALRRLVRGASLQELADELRKLPADEKTRGPAASELLSRLRALFTLEPSEAARVPALVRGEKDRTTYSTLLGALSAASTPEALHALGQVVADSRQPVAVRVDAAAGLGMAEKPSQEGVAALRELAQSNEPDLHSTATLALGNAARNLGAEDKAAGDALVKELSNAVLRAPTPQERALQLRALANSANPQALAMIQEAMRDPSPVVREAAVEALRLIPDPTADQLISRSMVEDPIPEVRRAAVFASSFRQLPPLWPALERTLRTDRVDAVRMEVVRLLGTNLGALPGASELLAWAGQNDPSGDVRHTALALLQPRVPTPRPSSPEPGAP